MKFDDAKEAFLKNQCGRTAADYVDAARDAYLQGKLTLQEVKACMEEIKYWLEKEINRHATEKSSDSGAAGRAVP